MATNQKGQCSVLPNMLSCPLCFQTVQDPPKGAFELADLNDLKRLLRQTAKDGKFTPDPLVSWSHHPSRAQFETYLRDLAGE